MTENKEGKMGTEAEVAGTLESADEDFETPVVHVFKKTEDCIEDVEYRKRPKWNSKTGKHNVWN